MAGLGLPLVLLIIVGVLNGPEPEADERPTAQGPTSSSSARSSESPTPSPRPTTTAPLATEPPSAALVTVTEVVDGDTIKVLAGVIVTVRILGIDAPEVGSSTGAQCWGAESTAFATQTLLNARVRLISDPTQDAIDVYGRQLAYVELSSGEDFSVLSVQAGHARNYTYSRPVARIAAIAAAEQTARAGGLGLWGSPCLGGLSPPLPVVAVPPPAPEPAPAPEPVPAPPVDAGTDPRFDTCRAANAGGYGPYVAGVDPEYDWYQDRDSDGIVCER